MINQKQVFDDAIALCYYRQRDIWGILRANMTVNFYDNPAFFLESAIKKFVLESNEGRLAQIDGTPIFEEPVIGYASGDDPLFDIYRDVVGRYHFTPREIIDRACSEEAVIHSATKSLTVIAWALPVAEKVRESNRLQVAVPSLHWSHTRWYGGRFDRLLSGYVCSILKGHGFQAVSPHNAMFCHPFLSPSESVPNGPAASWSERHAAYAAGLGTFSLGGGLITLRGIAVTCGSVVTDLALTPSPRSYINRFENCLFMRNSKCGECIERCPAAAITTSGHDKTKCWDYLRYDLLPLVSRYGVKATGCGLCQTRVPCEARIP